MLYKDTMAYTHSYQSVDMDQEKGERERGRQVESSGGVKQIRRSNRKWEEVMMHNNSYLSEHKASHAI